MTRGREYLSIWVHSIEDTEEGQAYRESVESFNEAFDGQYFADIEFVPRNDSGGGYSDKVNASVMAGGLPDVLTVDGPNISAYAANGIIQPLADLTEEEEGAYLPSIIEQGTVNDDLYALGVMESSVGFYYNKDIIEEAGIEIPDADHPWTWSEFLDILEDLKPLMDEKDGYPLDMTFPVGETSIYYYAPFVWSGGGELVSDDGLEVDGYFNSETTAAAMDYFRTIVQNGYMSEAPIDHLFESGESGLQVRRGLGGQHSLHKLSGSQSGSRPLRCERRLGRRHLHADRILGFRGFIRNGGYRGGHRACQVDERAWTAGSESGR